MTEIVKAQRVRIIREIEAAAASRQASGKLPWRPSWATYFGDRAGLLDALATRRQCLAIIRVDDLPGDLAGAPSPGRSSAPTPASTGSCIGTAAPAAS